MSDFKICSSMTTADSTEVNCDTSWCPGRLYLQSRSYTELQLIQLAYCCNKINDANRINYNWFFGKKSEKEELIELIKRHELD